MLRRALAAGGFGHDDLTGEYSPGSWS